MAERTMGADLMAPGSGGVSFEPQRMYNWKLLLPSDLGFAENTEIAVESITVPNITIEPIVLAYLNEDRKVPGAVTFAEATCVVKDFIQPDIAAEFMRWFKAVYDYETGGIGYATDIKKDIMLVLFGPKDMDAYRREWSLIGTWPSQFNMNELNMTNRNGYHTLNCVFQVDRMYPVM